MNATSRKCLRDTTSWETISNLYFPKDQRSENENNNNKIKPKAISKITLAKQPKEKMNKNINRCNTILKEIPVACK